MQMNLLDLKEHLEKAPILAKPLNEETSLSGNFYGSNKLRFCNGRRATIIVNILHK